MQSTNLGGYICYSIKWAGYQHGGVPLSKQDKGTACDNREVRGQEQIKSWVLV
jgi:hypothetical protein